MPDSPTTIYKDISQLTETAQKACNLFLEACKNKGIDIFITETYRSQTRQNYLYEQGRTRTGNIVTWTKNSRHTSKRAWDIATKGKDLYNADILKKAGAIATSLGITWGGIWTPPDYPHFEVAENWVMPITKEVKEDVKEDVKNHIKEEVQAVPEKRFKTLDELPDWGKPTIEELLKAGKISDKNNLDLTTDMLRVMVIMNR